MPDAWDLHLMPCGAWETPQNAMHAYAGGLPRKRGKTPAIEIKPGGDRIYPDGLITDTAIEHVKHLSQQTKPWLLAVGIIKPHLPFIGHAELQI